MQLREKSVDDETLLAMAQALQRLLRPFGIPLIINDHLHIARAVNAAGVHLGPHDASPEEAASTFGS